MSVFRRLSTARLLVLVGATAAAAIAAGVVAVVASGGGGATPPPQPLADAVHAALTAAKPDGVTATVRFTNNLLPSTDVFGGTTSALLSGATGRLWTTADGSGRIELQADAGDTQITWTKDVVQVYDSSSNTVYRYPLPARSGDATDTPPTLADVTDALAKVGEHWLLSGATPDDVAGLPAYSVTAAPKENGGLFGEGQLSWDATHGVPLRVAITAKGSSTPVLELAVTDISFGSVSSGDVTVAPPADAKVVDLSDTGGKSRTQEPLSFTPVAPAAVGGRTLTTKRQVGNGELLVYGDGLGALLVHESPVESSSKSPLPPVLETPLGTVLTFDHGGISFVVGGSVTRADAEAAAGAFGRS
jgi:hypothetical protein